MNNSTFFMSDPHFFHDNILKFDKERGERFKTIEEHNEFIKDELYALPKKSTVYLLGDLILKKNTDSYDWLHDMFQGLEVELNWILGNHDYKQIVESFGRYFNRVEHYIEEKYGGRKFVLSHYPLLSRNGMHRDQQSIHLHGHDHQHGTFMEGSRYNIAYNGHKLLYHIDGFMDGTHKDTERFITVGK